MPQRADGPRPKKFRVMNGGYVTQNGHKTLMRAGKIVDATTYDLSALRQQGIRLQELDATEKAPLTDADLYEPGPGEPPQPEPFGAYDRHPSGMTDDEIKQALTQGMRGTLRGQELDAEQKRRAAPKGDPPPAA